MSAEAQTIHRSFSHDAAMTHGTQPMRAELFHALRSRAERISLRTLERRGFRNVQVLDMQTIEKIVAESLTHMLERRTDFLSAEERAALEAEAKAEFAKVLAEHKSAAGKSDEERTRESNERQVQGLRAELERQESLLDSERKKNDGSRLALSPESFRQMEEKIRALFASLISAERRVSLADAGPKALVGLTELEREVAALLDRLLEGERGRLGGPAGGDASAVALMEKRILKLNKALADTEEQLRIVAEMKSGDPGIASIYDSIQGLSSLESNLEKKKEMLEIIFKENLAIQQNRTHRRSDVVAELRARVVARPLPAPAGFEAPLEHVTDEVAL